MRRFLLFIVVILCAITTNTLAQERRVTGKVTSAEDGGALPGVSVVAKGTTRGTQTDAEGNYSIVLPDNIATLVFSFVGVTTQEINVGNRTTVNVVMSNDTRSLDEVVVTGYGAQSKRNLTGNIAKVSAREIENIPVPSVEQAFQGKLAGVQVTSLNGKVGQGIQIRVRGASSLTASSQPLYVIDGIPITSSDQSSTTAPTNPIADLNPNDIESLEVLKDASASAIYGARASNGVVLITTKKGKAGKTVFEASAQVGASSPTHLRTWLNTQQYVELLQEARANTEAFSANSLGNILTSFAANNPAGWQGANPAYSTDWQKEAFQSAPSQQYDLSARGGDAKTRFFVSGQYFDQNGILIKNRFRRLGARANLEHNATDKLTIGVNFNLTHSINDRVSNDNAFSTPLQIVALPPMTPVIDPRTNQLSGNYTLYYNPLLNRDFASLQARVYRIIGNAFADYKILPGLSFRTEFGTDLLAQQEEEYYGRETARNTGAPNGLGSNSFRQVTNYTTNNYFTFGQTFAENHAVDATLGMSYQESRSNYNSVTGQQFPSNAYKQLSSAARITAGDGSETRFSFLSYFARLNYRFNDRYLVGVSGRIDGSSRFGANNKYGFFPAVSAGWIITQESFMQNVKALSTLKLRASYGLTGNAEIGNFNSQALFSATNNLGSSAGYAGVPGQAPTQLANPDLTWEKTLQTDIGLEYGFLGDRITGEIDFYQKNTSGLLLSVNVPGSTGYRSQLRNVGNLENKGIEFVFNSQNLVGDFRWTTSLNVAYNKNVVTNLGGTTITGSFLNRAQEGQPIGVFVGPEYAGVDVQNGDALYYTNTDLGNGARDRATTNDYNAAAYVPLGSPTPKFTGGVTNTFNYKGIDLSFLFQGQFGNYIYNGGGKFQEANGDYFDNQDISQLRRWRNPGDITDVPQARLYGANGTGESSRYLQKGDYVRLRTVTLGYALPKSIIGRLGLNRVRVYVTGQNLLTFTNYTGWDPEVNSDAYQSNPVNLGIDFYSAPQPRTIVGGLQIGF